MLTLRFEADKKALAELYGALGIEGEAGGANFLFYDDSKPVGLMRVRLDKNEATMEKIHFLPDVPEEDKNFFFRAMLYKFGEGAPVKLKIDGYRPELEIFGFKREGNAMAVHSSEIKLINCVGCGGQDKYGRN